MDKKKVTIVTHNSKFHIDDVFAVATLVLMLEKDHEIEIVRTRDEVLIAEGDYVVDVGGVYDSEKNRFDHHQEGGAGGRENGVAYSSLGLVWQKYGELVSGSREVANALDHVLVQPIDAHDNGMYYIETKIPGLHPYDLKPIISVFRPTWKEEQDFDGIFNTIVPYAKVLLERQIAHTRDRMELAQIIEDIYYKTEDKRIIVLDKGYSGAGRFLEKFPEPLFIVYPPGNSYPSWSLRVMDTDGFLYTARKMLPLVWAGKMDEELEKVTGVPDVVFCHNKRFIAVAKTKEAILKLAELALKD